MYSCRQHIPDLLNEEKKRIADALNGKEVFLIADESDVKGCKYFNILVGDLSIPSKAWLLDCVPLDSRANNQTVCQLVDNALRDLSIPRNDFYLFITDAARYMKLAGSVLKTLHPNMFHITCLAHMLHNCAMKIQAFFPAIDFVIASVKEITVKNKDRRLQFSAVGPIPKPVVTR